MYAARLLSAGAVVALPTETVYGLAADVANPAAVRRIYAIKGRPLDHPLIVHAYELAALDGYVAAITPQMRALADAFWPGPLTMIVARGSRTPRAVTGGQETVAVRVPAHALAREVLRRFGGALAAPSANRFGAVSPTTAEHVRADLGTDVDFVLDGGAADVGVESTIVDLSGEVPAILRAGAITATQISDVLGVPVVVRADGGEVRAPGTLASHYATRARIVLVDDAEIDGEVLRAVARGEHTAVLTLPADPAAAARGLYAAMRALDADGYETIVAALPSDTAANAAVRDRLTRAAAPR